MLVRGIRGDDLAGLTSIAKNIKQGTLEGFDQGQGVVIGRRLADQLTLRAGDSVTLVSPRGAVTPMGTTPRIKVYKIAAVFEIGMSEYDAAFVFMPLDRGAGLFQPEQRRHRDRGLHRRPRQDRAYRQMVTEAAKRPIFMIDWRQRNATFFSALQVERNVMFLILTLIVLVAAFNIASSLIMLVKDKGRDIGILRTMGASQGSIMRVFLITGAAIGVIGDLVGIPGRACGVPQHRVDPAIHVVADQHRAVLAGALLPVAAAGRSRRRRDHGGGGDGAGAFAAGNALPVVARGAPRSGRSAALRMSRRWPNSETPVVFLRQVERRYHQGDAVLEILKGGDLAVWPGQSVALVAPSGAGKSTLLHIAGLLEHPDGGEVYLDGAPTGGPVGCRPHPDAAQLDRLRLSGAPPAAGVLRGRERHAAADDPRPGARRGAQARASELLSYLGLGERLTHRPAELSGGEQQRVAIARAVANVPRLLLADEPTGNLDPRTSDHVFHALAQLIRASGLTVMLATHNMEIAARMDRRVTIRDGLIVEMP